MVVAGSLPPGIVTEAALFEGTGSGVPDWILVATVTDSAPVPVGVVKASVTVTLSPELSEAGRPV